MNSLTVVYDGQCRMCTHTMAKLEKRFGSAIHGVDFRTTDPALIHPQLTEHALQARIHVMDGGQIYKGAAALVRIGRLHPVWRWFLWLYDVPPIGWCAEVGYDWVARHRFTLSRWFKQTPSCGDSCTVHYRDSKTKHR